MRIKFYSLLVSILYSIFRAEDSFGPNTGVVKQRRVMKEAHQKAVKEGILSSVEGTFAPNIIELILRVIEVIVELLHAFGIFEREPDINVLRREDENK